MISPLPSLSQTINPPKTKETPESKSKNKTKTKYSPSINIHIHYLRLYAQIESSPYYPILSHLISIYLSIA